MGVTQPKSNDSNFQATLPSYITHTKSIFMCLLSNWHNFTKNNLELWNFSHRKKNAHLRNNLEQKLINIKWSPFFDWHEDAFKKKFKFQNHFLKRVLS